MVRTAYAADLQQAFKQMIIEVRRAAGHMTQRILALGALADLVEIVIAFIGEQLFAEFHAHGCYASLRAAPSGTALRGIQNGFDNGFIAGAPAYIAGDRFNDLVTARVRVAVQQGLGGHQHAG